MSTPLDPIYCRKCHKLLSRTVTFCDACQWDQFKRFDPKAEARRKAEEAKEAVVGATSSQLQDAGAVSVNELLRGDVSVQSQPPPHAWANS